MGFNQEPLGCQMAMTNEWAQVDLVPWNPGAKISACLRAIWCDVVAHNREFPSSK